jgi:hypothetical protein
MNEIVVLDLVNNERNTFGSVSEAEKWILNNYTDEVEGIHPDIESIQILQVLKQVEVEELDNKKHSISFVPVELPVKPAKDGLMSDLEIAITRLIIDKANEIASGRKEASIEVGLLTQVVMPLVKELER